VQGLGFGGEWAVGAVLISETINPRLRGRVVGAVQAGWAIGYGLAVLISVVLFTQLPPDIGWRVFFFIGLIPALLVLWIRRNITEAPLFAEEQRGRAAARAPGGASLWGIFGRAALPTTLKATLLTTGIYGGNYVMITWLPTYLRLSLHLPTPNAGAYLAINILGSFCGAFLNGWMADAVGRRKTFIMIACVQVVVVAVYTLTPIGSVVTCFWASFSACCNPAPPAVPAPSSRSCSRPGSAPPARASAAMAGAPSAPSCRRWSAFSPIGCRSAPPWGFAPAPPIWGS
jgi:MFS family permease